MKGIVQRGIFLLAAAFPFGLAAVFALLVFFGGIGQLFGHGLDFYGLPSFSAHLARSVVGFAILVGMVVGIVFTGINVDRTRGKIYVPLPILLVSIAIAIRLVVVASFGCGTAPTTDNGFAWFRAIGRPSVADYHMTIPCWMNYSLLLRALAIIFGNDYRVDLVAGVVFDGVSTFLVFLLAFRVTGRNAAASLAASLFALNPALVVYALAGTPEHLAIAIFLAAALLYRRLTEEGGGGKIMLLALACGLTLGVGNAIKPIFPLVGTAMALSVILGAGDKARLVRLSCALAVAFVVQFGVVRCITAASESVFDVSLSDKNSVAHMLVVGLNRQGEGQVGIGNVSRTVQNALKAGMPMDEAARIGYKTMQDDWRGHLDEVPRFFARKFIWAWQDFNRPCRYFQRDAARFLKRNPKAKARSLRKLLYRCLVDVLPPVNGLVYLGAMAAGMWWAVVCGLRKRDVRAIDMFVVMMLLGFFCMLALIEAQSRYKCLVLPFAFIFVSQGFGDWIGKRAAAREVTDAR